MGSEQDTGQRPQQAMCGEGMVEGTWSSGRREDAQSRVGVYVEQREGNPEPTL